MSKYKRENKPRYALLPRAAIDTVARVATKGAAKHAPWGYLADENVSDEDIVDALLRHAFEVADGTWLDSDEGGTDEPHAAAVCFNALMLLQRVHERGGHGLQLELGNARSKYRKRNKVRR